MTEPIELEDVVARWSEESLTVDDATIDALLGREAGPWIPLGEAEAVAGVSRSTLRAWYRSGRIPSRLMPGPHGLQRLVPRDAVLEQAARSPRAGTPHRPIADQQPDRPSAPGDSDTDVVRLAELAVAEARERTAAAEARAEAAETALHAALERAAAAEAELRLLRDGAAPA
jgi:transposase